MNFNNKFLLYGIYNRSCDCMFKEIPTKEFKNINFELLTQIGKFLLVKSGCILDIDVEQNGVDTIRGVSWKEIYSVVKLLLKITKVLNYLETLESSNHISMYENSYKNYARNNLSELLFQVYRKFQQWKKADQFNDMYIFEEEDEFFDLYINISKWCNMVAIEIEIVTGSIVEVVKNGSAMVIQSCVRNFMKRRSIGIYSRYSILSNSYHDITFNKSVDTSENIRLCGNHIVCSHIILSTMMSTLPSWSKWSDWFEESVLDKVVNEYGETCKETYLWYCTDWLPREYTIPSIEDRDAEILINDE